MLLTGFIEPSQLENVDAAVTLRSSTIRDYVLSREDQYYPNGYCLKFVEECYQNLGATRPYSCCASKSGNMFIRSTSSSDIPVGSTVYFGNCGGGPCRSCGSSYYGHVGIYVGDGYFVHATGGKVQKSTISSWANKYRGYGYCGNFNLSQDISTSDNNNNSFGSPVDLGTNFYAYIINTYAWKHLTNDSSNVSMRSETGTANQIWKFERQGDGSYKIINLKDNLVLDDHNFGQTDGTNVAVCGSNDSDAQRWFIYGTSGSYSLRAKCGNLVLDVNGGSKADGTNVQMWTKNDTVAQKFQIWKLNQPGKTNVYCSVGSGYANTTFSWDKASNASTYDLKIWKDKLWQGDAYQILWNLSGTSAQVCLPPGYYEAYVDSRNGSLINMSNNVVKFTVSNGSPVNLGNDLYVTIITNKNQLAFTNTNGNVDVRKQDGSAKQVWRFKRQSDGSYTIQNMADSKYLDTDNSRDSNGTNIKTWSYNGSDAQKYFIYGSKSGEYILKPKCAVRVVDVCGGKNNPGDNVQLWNFNGGDAQRLAIVKTNNPIKAECTHKFGSWTITQKATCSVNGSEQRKCSLCGKIETRTIKATGHKYTDKVIAPTTTQKGYTLHTCKECGYSYKSDYTEYTKHLSYILVTVKPNKTEYYLSEKIDTAGMKVIAGYSDKTEREVTGWTISGDTSKEGNSWVIVKYTENGKTVSTYYRIVVKKRTDERITITYDSCGGDLGVKNRGGIIGVTTSVWSEIPKKNYQLTLDSNGGTVSNKMISIRAPFIAWYSSPGAKGTRYNTGQTVSFKNSMTLYAAYGKASVGNLPSPSRDGYIFEGWYLSDGTKVANATQISDNCTLIAKWQEKVKETPHIHTPGEWETVREATMTAPGEQVLRCQECGQVMQSEAIPILIETDTEGNDDAFTGDSSTDKPVTDDSEFITEDDPIYNPAEEMEDESFLVGDEITTNREIFTVTKIGKNPSVEYTELFDDDVTDVAIPESITIYGVTYKVTSIAPKAFYKNTSIKSVTLTSSVSKIGSKAFYGCTSLKNIVIFSTKLKSNAIGTNAFTKVAKNVKVYVPSAKYKTYKTMLKKAGIGSKAKIYRWVERLS